MKKAQIASALTLAMALTGIAAGPAAWPRHRAVKKGWESAAGSKR